MNAPLTLRLVPEPSEFDAAMDELAVLARGLPPDLHDAVYDVCSDDTRELVAFHRVADAAALAGHYRVGLQPSEFLNGLLAACRAGERDVQVFLRHLDSPSVGAGILPQGAA